MEKSLYPLNPILIIDDEKIALRSYELAFLTSGINNIICCEDSRKAYELVKNKEPELVLLDLVMPYVSGEELLEKIAAEYPGIPVIMVTGVNEINSAVNCMRSGASDYIVKPISSERLISRVRKVLELHELRKENISLQERMLSGKYTSHEAFSRIVTRNKQMLSIFQYCEAIAKSRQPVLVTGETGSGKELFAQAIHQLSESSGKFVPVNISGFDDSLLSDTLFGHRKGAFTGAMENRDGMIERASGGSLFLDEIGDLNIASQVKLLRLLQEREYSPLGSDIAKLSDARIILATHQDLKGLQKDSKFRKDLYYRISTHHIQIPPLRERKEDIQMILDHFLKSAAEELNKKVPVYHPELLTLLKSYNFPGNVRELQSMVYDAVSSHKSKMLSMNSFKSHINIHSASSEYSPETGRHDGTNDWASRIEVLPTIKEATATLLEEALQRSNQNQSVAARLLGITPQALSARLKKL
ncbi:MAG: two-component system response regulator [Lentisphaerae bacterium GWF2_44_16]|nr:MAG: two-component system response regulator [Lentisphaerae bacterium GWF2_44_16]